MANTTYLVKVDGAEVATKSKKASAVETADGLRSEHPTATIVVETNGGTVVHTVRVKGSHSKPWTRTETYDGIEVEVPSGYVVAYVRKRVAAVVARNEDKSGWLVLQAGKDPIEAKNTVEAREVTNQLALDYAAARAAEKEAAAKARAEAKAEKEAAREEARKAKEAEKAAKAEEKAKAKAEAEAAEAQAEAEAEVEATEEA